MTWCLITSPRERGGKDLESCTCSLSWRRQCCPADRRCTELLRPGGAAPSLGVCHGVCHKICVDCEGEAERTMEFCSGDVAWKKLGPKGKEQRGQNSTSCCGSPSLHRPCLSASVNQRPHPGESSSLASVMSDSFFYTIWHIYMQAVKFHHQKLVHFNFDRSVVHLSVMS